jgi:hypothetical protein
MPSGFATSFSAPEERKLAAAAQAAALFTNSLLEIAGIVASYFSSSRLKFPSTPPFRADKLLRQIRIYR